MSNVEIDDVDDDLDDDEFGEDEPSEPKLIKQLRGTTRQQKKMIRDLTAQVQANASAQRRLAIMDAELPKTKQIDFFLSKYEGEWDKDSLRAAASEAGFLEAEENEVGEEVDSVEAMMNASRGGWPSAPPGSNQAVKDKIAQVKPGPMAADQIAKIMADAGLLVNEE
jgi:hypothetical protein